MNWPKRVARSFFSKKVSISVVATLPIVLSICKASLPRAGVTMAVGNTFIPIPVGRTVGGSTTVNSGTCYRMPSRVFADWHNHHGLTELSPDSMDPFMGRWKMLGVKQAPRSLLQGNQPIADGCDKLGISHHGPLARNALIVMGKDSAVLVVRRMPSGRPMFRSSRWRCKAGAQL